MHGNENDNGIHGHEQSRSSSWDPSSVPLSASHSKEGSVRLESWLKGGTMIMSLAEVFRCLE